MTRLLYFILPLLWCQSLLSQISFVKQVGSTAVTANADTCVITVAAGGVAQNNLISGIGVHESEFTITGVADSRSNTYTLGSSQVITSGDSFSTHVFHGVATTALQAADTITVTFSGGGFTTKKCKALEYSGTATVSVTDGSNLGIDTAFPRSAATSTGNVTTTNADDVLVVHCGSENTGGAPGWTPTTNFTARGTTMTQDATSVYSEDRIVSSTGTYSGAPTLSTDQYWGCHVTAFKSGTPPPPPTRFYLPSTGAAAVNPAFTHQASWGATTNADRIRAVTTKISSAMTSRTETKAVTAGTNHLIRQYVSDPVDAQTIAAGTVKGTIRVAESATNDNLDQVTLKIVVVSNDGSTLTGTLLNLGNYVAVSEFVVTTLTNRRIADGDATSSLAVNEGDRIVIEIGFANSTTGTSVSGTMNFGDDSATDLADDATGTVANNPFVELSSEITFQSVASVLKRKPVIFQ